MCEINYVEKRPYGLVINKDKNPRVTKDCLKNNKFKVTDYVGYFMVYGVAHKEILSDAITMFDINDGDFPTIQSSVKRLIISYFSEATNIFTIDDNISLCFISNILTQLKVKYEVYSNIIHIYEPQTLIAVLDKEDDIPNLTQIITAYNSDNKTMSSTAPNTIVIRTKEWVEENIFTTNYHGIVIPKPVLYEQEVVLSVAIAMSQIKFIESNGSYTSNEDVVGLIDVFDSELIIYDKIEIQKTKVKR